MHPMLHAQLPHLTLQLLLCLDPSPPWDLFSALALTLISYFTISSSALKLDSDNDYMGFGSLTASCVVNGFYLLLLGKPLRTFKYVGNGTGNVHNDSKWKRYFDVVCVTCSPRGIGWNTQVKNIPLAPRQPRRSFVLRSALRAAWYWVLFEAGRLYISYNPSFSLATIGAEGYAQRCIDASIFIGLTYWSMNAMYLAVAAGSVGIGLSEPRMWPDMFGAWSDAYTVRRFWGRTWHQLMRRFLGPLGKVTSTAFGFNPGTLGSSYTQLYVAFILSGLIHTGGDMLLYSHTSATSISRPFFSMPFFLLQAIIITLEDMFIGITKRLRVKSSAWTRVLGYVWVATWFGWCVSEFVKNLIRAGGGITKPGADRNAMDSNLVRVMLELLGFDIGVFAESWFWRPEPFNDISMPT